MQGGTALLGYVSYAHSASTLLSRLADGAAATYLPSTMLGQTKYVHTARQCYLYRDRSVYLMDDHQYHDPA